MRKRIYNPKFAWPVVCATPPKPKFQKISIVIAVHGQSRYTVSVLKELKQYVPKAEIIIVDNASPDNTLEKIKDFNVKIIKMESNESLAKAWNAGLAEATGDVLAVLNNDVKLMPDGISRLAQMAWEVGISGASGCHVNPDSLFFVAHVDDPGSDYVAGHAMFFRRDVFEEVGGFDEHMKPAYCEDSDWCFRARSKGFSWGFCQDALYHIGGVTAATMPHVQNAIAANVARLQSKWSNKGIGERHKIVIRSLKSLKHFEGVIAAFKISKPNAWIMISTTPELLEQLKSNPVIDKYVDEICLSDKRFPNFTPTLRTVINHYTKVWKDGEFMKQYGRLSPEPVEPIIEQIASTDDAVADILDHRQIEQKTDRKPTKRKKTDKAADISA